MAQPEPDLSDKAFLLSVGPPLTLRILASGAMEIGCLQDIPAQGVSVHAILRFAPEAAGQLAQGILHLVETGAVRIESIDKPTPTQ